MKVLGLVVEYNPFHNGHVYHIKQSKKLSSADHVICVMSGNFIQRGEPAIVNKWARAKMALLQGADLILELPIPYAVSSAEYFAYGSVKILNDIGVVDYLCFGSENGDTRELDIIAQTLIDEPEKYKTFLKEELKKGSSYPTSRQTALERYFKTENILINEIESIISSSNNILGIEYLKALKKLNSNIIPLTIKRIGNSYNEECLTGAFSSATSIRKLICETMHSTKEELLDELHLNDVLPQTSFDILKEELTAGRGPIFSYHFDTMLLALIRRMETSHIKTFAHITEGLENRIKKSANISSSIEELVNNICTKRYTRTRIQRILTNILTGLSSHDFDAFNISGPPYARVLGFNEKGRKLLSIMNEESRLPIILKTSNFINSSNDLIRRMLELEAVATDIYVLAYKNLEFKKGSQDFTQKVVMIP